jgi:hypothetical protein
MPDSPPSLSLSLSLSLQTEILTHFFLSCSISSIDKKLQEFIIRPASTHFGVMCRLLDHHKESSDWDSS